MHGKWGRNKGRSRGVGVTTRKISHSCEHTDDTSESFSITGFRNMSSLRTKPDPSHFLW